MGFYDCPRFSYRPFNSTDVTIYLSRAARAVTEKATMGVISAINAMNASMNATRLSSVNLASALETYAAVIANPPPPYSFSPPSPMQTSQNGARGMCFTHAAVFWMEWATIQANLQLSLMQDLFKLKSLADLAGERKRGVNIDIEPHEFDILEAESIRSMVVKLTKLSHDSFQEGYRKGTDWNGVGGLDYWITQVERYDAIIPRRAPSMAASKLSDSLNTPPRSIADTVESGFAAKVTRTEQDNFSLKRKRNNEDLRGSKASDNDSNSSYSRRSKSNSTLRNERIPSDITNTQRTTGVSGKFPCSESDNDDARIMSRGEKMDNPNSDIYPTSPASHKQSESEHTVTVDIDIPVDWGRSDSVIMTAPAFPMEDWDAGPQGEGCHKGATSYNGIMEVKNILNDSDNGSGSTDYESASSDSGGSDFDNFFRDTIDHPASRVSGGPGLGVHKQESALEDQETGLRNRNLVEKAARRSWLENICSIGRPKLAATHKITERRSNESNIDDPYFPDSDQNTGTFPGTYSFHHIPYAITEEGTLKSIAPGCERPNVCSVFPTTGLETFEQAAEIRFPSGVGIRRRGKFQKKNGYLQMLATEEEDIWDKAKPAPGSSLIPKESVNGGRWENQHLGVIGFQKGTYSSQQLEIPIDVGNIVGLPKNSKFGYFTEDFQQKSSIVGEECGNVPAFPWSRLSCVGEPQPATRRTDTFVGHVDGTPTLLKRMRRNCFRGSEVDSE